MTAFGFSLGSQLCICLVATARLAATALSPISIKGSKLYRDDGSQFFAKGVAYGPNNGTILDPLANSSQCQIDAGLMNAIGVNTIHVYFTDANKNHDACMQAFATLGIYVWMELDSYKVSISRDNPAWTMGMYSNWTATVDAFAKYENILTFSAGDQLLNSAESTHAAPYVKAAIRDIKAFRDARGYRPIPLSYTGADIPTYRILMADYLACRTQSDNGSDHSVGASSNIDLYGLAVFSWCGNSSYTSSGYDTLYEQFEKFNVPVLFSEAGCSVPGLPHNFDDVFTMLGPVFQSLFSGAIVWQWGMPEGGDENNDGIVQYSNNAETGFPLTLTAYNALSTIFAQQNSPGTAKTAYTPSNTAPACPTFDSASDLSGWLVNPSDALPTIPGLNISTITARVSLSSSVTVTSMTETDTSGAATGQATEGVTGSSGGDGGLSGGAIAGVVVGCVLGVMVLAGVSFFITKRCRPRASSERKYKTPEPDPVGNGDEGPPCDGRRIELPARSVGRVASKQELEAPFPPQHTDSESLRGLDVQTDAVGDPGPYELYSLAGFKLQGHVSQEIESDVYN